MIEVEVPQFPMKLQIRDTNGKLFGESLASTPSTKINVSGLPAGVYFIQGWANGQKLVERFVKE